MLIYNSGQAREADWRSIGMGGCHFIQSLGAKIRRGCIFTAILSIKLMAEIITIKEIVKDRIFRKCGAHRFRVST